MLRKARLVWVRSFLHTNEWRWNWKVVVLWTILFVGESGGLVLAVIEESWAGGVVASALLVFTVLAALLGEMPLVGRTGQSRRRKLASKALGIPLRIYTLEQYRKGAIESPPFVALNGNHLKWPDSLDRMSPEVLATHLVGFMYAAAPDTFTAGHIDELARGIVRDALADDSVFILPLRGPDRVEGYEERFYTAVHESYRKVMNEIGPPL